MMFLTISNKKLGIAPIYYLSIVILASSLFYLEINNAENYEKVKLSKEILT